MQACQNLVLCEPLTLSPGPRSQRRPVLPPARYSRRHGGPAAAAAAPAGLHACVEVRERAQVDVRLLPQGTAGLKASGRGGVAFGQVQVDTI